METRPKGNQALQSKNRFTRSTFWSQLLIKLKEVNDSKQHFYELKQCQKNNCIQKMDCVNRPFQFAKSSSLKPGLQKAKVDYDNDQFRVKTKQLVGRMTAQPHNHFVFLCRCCRACCKWKLGLNNEVAITVSYKARIKD